MKVLISPAKMLEESRELPVKTGTQPLYFTEAAKITKKLARMSRKQIADLMGISYQLADLNYQRFQDFDLTNKNSRPAMYLYGGGTYQGLDAYTIPPDKLDAFQENLRIISGMYGLLRPLDLIQPYRLEMHVKFPIGRHKDLYSFWTRKITKSLIELLDGNDLLLNLASKEYAQAVDFKKMDIRVISPIFKDFKNGTFKVISFFAKEARGAMARYVIDNNISDQEGIRSFSGRGYLFSEEQTVKENEPVFVR